MITFRDINAIRAIASETFDIADQPEVRAGLDDIMERLDILLSDLATVDAKIADATDALLEHVEPPKATKSVTPPAGNFADEAWQFAVAMTRVHMSVVS